MSDPSCTASTLAEGQPETGYEVAALLLATLETELGRVELLREKAAQTLQTLNGQVAATPLDRLAAWKLYWTGPAVRVDAIAAGLTLGGIPCRTHEVFSVVGPGPVVGLCGYCAEPVKAKNRNHVTEVTSRRYGPEITHDHCRALAIAQSFASRQEEARQVAEYQRWLRTIPYAEYLLTAHWQEQRRRALRRAHYRCQVCNTDNTVLDVHHRTYERRGCERSDDLTVLCRDCHAHHHGKEAR